MEVKKVLEKLNTAKSAGLHGLRAELHKKLINYRRAIEILNASYKKVPEERHETSEWNKNKNQL